MLLVRQIRPLGLKTGHYPLVVSRRERYWDHTGRRPKARSTLRHTPTRPGSTCKLLVPRKKVGCESGCAWRYSSTSSNFCAASTGPPKTQSDDNNPVTAIEIVDHSCRLSRRVKRPIEVVVLNCCVTETKDALVASRISTILAKSASERVSRSTL